MLCRMYVWHERDKRGGRMLGGRPCKEEGKARHTLRMPESSYGRTCELSFLGELQGCEREEEQWEGEGQWEDGFALCQHDVENVEEMR